MINIGYQGIENCYTYQVIQTFLNNYNPIGYKNFINVFDSLINHQVDYILIPIENSTGGSIYINYDMFYKYQHEHNITIIREYTFQVNHCLYINKNADKKDIKYVLSHPQALAQCMSNIHTNNWEAIDSWDTTGSISEMVEKGDEYACIAPSGLENVNSDIKPIVSNFNDESINITRFYLITLNKKTITYDNHSVKFSSYIIIKDEIGILGILLEGFKKNNINLTKIESRPLHGAPFKYIFFIEGMGIYQDIKYISTQYSFNYEYHLLGIFPTELSLLNIKIIKQKLNIGIIGFGRFGQFIGKKMSYYGFNVVCTSRTNYTDIANKYGITYLDKDVFEKKDIDVVILSPSIHSFENVIDSYDISFWKDKLVCDVLSVKEYPFRILKDKINENILCTHPMFGPDSAPDSWSNKKFIYHPHNIRLSVYKSYDIFMKFWGDVGCELIRMNPHEHDKETSNSQFITHFIGRTLEPFQSGDTNIYTDGFNALMKIKDHSIHDSWDLFSALAEYNPNTKESIQILLFNLHTIYNKLFNKKHEESSTSKIFNKIIELKNTTTRDIINCGAGVPSWKPPIDLPCEYSTSKGNPVLISKIVHYYQHGSIENKDIVSIQKENIIITPGAKPALYMLINLLTLPGSKWIIPIPYWVSYGSMVENCLGEPIFVKTTIKNLWECNKDTLEKYFNQNSVNGIILSNPCNPTGHVYRDEYICTIKELCKKYNKYFIVDEVYLPLTNRETLYDGTKNTIIVNSFSKRWGIPGFRVGWVVADADIIKDLCSLQSTINTCSPTVSQELAIKLLEEGYTPDLTVLHKSKTELSEILKQKGWTLTDNNYLSLYLFPIKDGVDIDKLIQTLLDNDLAVIHGNAFGVENGFRMTLWNKDDVLDRMKTILNDVL